MKNNLTGIFISALLHVGLFSWVLGITNTPVEKFIPADNLALTISMFQAEVIAPPVIEPIKVKSTEKVVEKATPLNPEFADLPPIVKVEPIKVEPKIEPEPEPPAPVTIAEKKPDVKKEVIEVVEQSKLAMLEPIPERVKPKELVKTKVIKKARVKKKPPLKKVVKKAKKKPIKKVIKRRIVKKTVKPKVIKRKVQRRIVKKAKPIRKPQKRAVAKVKPRPQAISQHKKRIVRHQKSKKVGGVSLQNTQARHQQTVQRIKPAIRTVKRGVAPQRSKSSAKTPATNSANNARLTQQFKAKLQQLIASKKRYPKRAKRRGQQGKVTVSFHIRHSGIITDIRIIKGARNKSLNEATIAAIKLASGKLIYPKGMNKKSLNLTITLSYILS